MLKLQGKLVYLAALTRQDCKTLWEDAEYDFTNLTEPLNVGWPGEKSDEWFDEIKKLHDNMHIRLGIYLPDGKIIGDIGLQDINWKNRSCTIGFGLAKLEYRNKGYATDAVLTVLDYAFNNLGFERIGSSTLEQNLASRRVHEKCGFVLEGVQRKAEYFAGKRWDSLMFGILREDFHKE